MTIYPTQDYAVITGDIVRSSTLNAVERASLRIEIKRASQALQEKFPDDVIQPVDVFRGDGWQFVISRPERAFRVGLFFRAWIRAHVPPGRRLDTRMAVAVGRVTSIPTNWVSGGDGEAFRASGRALEHLREPLRLALVVPPTAAPGLAAALGAFAPVFDSLVQGWTQCQSRAVVARLHGATQDAIAHTWPETITRQAIARHLAKAHWPAVESGLHWWEGSPWRLQMS